VLTSTPLLVDPAVLALACALRDRGLRAHPQVVSVCGEPDVRLVVCREREEVAVEVLAAPAGEPPAARWHAVRVRGEDRHVWQGPPHDAPLGEAVAFVEALLAPHAGALRYPHLG
jgi:hypothetical protein